MNILRIALKNIRGNTVKSLTIFLCILGVAAFFVSTTLIVQGAQNSLRRGLERLGADILVVPEGAENKMESALLMGTPIKLWMPEQNLAKVAQVEGVGQASPQIYLQSLFGAHCCAVSEMFMVVFDPAKIQDHSTFEDPHQLSTGMSHVFVNGVQVLRNGEHTGATPGRVVRGPGWNRKAGD